MTRYTTVTNVTLKNLFNATEIKQKYNKMGKMHTYIIGHYNSSVRIIDLVSHTTYVACVNFIHK